MYTITLFTGTASKTAFTQLDYSANEVKTVHSYLSVVILLTELTASIYTFRCDSHFVRLRSPRIMCRNANVNALSGFSGSVEHVEWRD